MRILIFGDVHGNLPALEKLFKIEKGNFDSFVSHGDVVNYGPWTNECVLFLENQATGTLLKGNHEEAFLSGQYNGTNIIASTFFNYCYEKFDPLLMPVIGKYGNEAVLGDYVVRHTIGDRYIFADTDISDMSLNANFIIGHSHQQFKREKEGNWIYNTGSIGQNRAYINVSNYILYDTVTKNIDLKSYIHDIDAVIKKMQDERYPELCLDYYNSKKRA